MELNEYQERAMTTCMDSCNNFSYMFINLVAETGEFASKVAKSIRKEEYVINGNKISFAKEPCEAEEKAKKSKELMLEAGDILWQLSGLCKVMGWDLEQVAQANLDKLASRKERNKIDGDGDNR